MSTTPNGSPQRSDSFQYAAYGNRKPTVPACDIAEVISRGSLGDFNRDLGPPAVIMEDVVQSPLRSPSTKEDGPIYGELIVVGTNGRLRCPPLSAKMKNKFVLKRHAKPSGVKPVYRDAASEGQPTPGAYTVSVTLPKLRTCVTEFETDSTTDLFQIGRSVDSCINFIVVDTEVSPQGVEQYKLNSTVSRYACRILCQREPPYTARLYAAAFDINNRIKISTLAPTWLSPKSNESDGLTTNGVMFMRPSGHFEPGVASGPWREVTVMGGVRELRAKRSSKTPGAEASQESNILTDGCLIDLCGITLLWRSAMGLMQAPTSQVLTEHRRALNDAKMLCPVGLQTLYIPKGSQDGSGSRQPWAYLSCGHVHGYHDWKANDKETRDNRTCPICRKVGPFVPLTYGEEGGYCTDMGEQQCAFIPCGHMCSESTAKYWSSTEMPYALDKWSTVCPFCKIPLSNSKDSFGYIRLVFP